MRHDRFTFTQHLFIDGTATPEELVREDDQLLAKADEFPTGVWFTFIALRRYTVATCTEKSFRGCAGDEHCTQHEKFKENVAQYYEDYKNGDKDLKIKACIFLQNWWQIHVLEVDKTYVPYVKGGRDQHFRIIE